MSTTTRGSSSGSGSSSSSSSSSSDGDIKRPVARLPSPAPALPPSTSALGDDTSSPSAAATAALTTLTDCMRSIVVGDLKYAQCVMDTGLFALSAPQPPALTQQLRNTSTPEAMLLAYVRTQLPSSTARDTQFGMCHLQCTAPSFRASRSCCDATRRLRACRLTAPTPALTTCKRSLDASLAFSNQECAVLTREDTALVTVTTLASVAAMAAGSLVVYRRRRAQRKLQRSSSSTPTESASLDVAKSPSSSSPSLQDHALAKWMRQVAVLVWKNLVLRVRRPVALLFEQLVPLLFVSALVVLANLDSLFGHDADSVYRSGRHAASLNSTLFCVQLASLSASDLGAPSGTMRSFYSSGQSVVGLFFLLSFIKLVSSTTAAMVLEKELKMREMLKIMGVTNSALLASWVATSTILSLPVVFVLAALLKFGNVFPTTPYATVVFVFWSLTLAIVAFAYALTPFFHKARTAAIVSVLLWLLLFFPFFDVQPKTTGAKLGGALAPPTAFALAIDRLLREAQLGTGFAYSMTKAATTSAFAGVPSAEAMSLFLLLDACLLLLLGWYFEQVVPQPYGVRKPWYFPFQFNYWQPPQAKFKLTLSSSPNMVPSPSFYALGSPDGDRNNAADSPIHHFSGGATPGTALLQIPIAEERRSSSIATLVEPVSAELAVQEHTGASLQLRALTKTFKLVDGEEKTAVDELSLTFYSGQITSLLGHNGAGKTTTISMLTGLYPPTSGDALLFGRSLQTESDAFRQIMGVCPQHDVLFPELSVDEHLEFFAVIKGIRGREAIAQSVDTLVHDVGLVGARRVLAKNLSGGQKRKLSVALALTGDTKLVFFDEPTSGMDPYSRRFTWNLLRRQRAGRVIVLTTHFMDEADVLGDRIAILADGKLKCVGSSLFLKTRFGAGYNLTIIKRSDGDGIPFVVEKVHRLVESLLGDGESQLASDSASEVVFTLSTRSSSQFPRLFDALDRDMALLGICNYGISVTTLEDVFLSIANDRGDHDDDDVPAAPKASPPSVMRSLTSTPPFRDQVQTQLLKRWWISKRDKKSLLNAMAIPLLFLLVLVLLPEIQVASFLPDYATSFATQAQQDACPPAQIKENLLSRATMDRCMGTGFGFCSLGLIDCDAAVCCDATRPQSPFYACSTCPIPATKVVATEPCFSSKCMTRSGAKLQVALNGFIVAMLVMLAFAFLPAAVIAFVVKEKDPTQDAKSLQWISGMALPAYWTANFVHDMVVVSWTVAAALVIVPLSRRALSGPQEVGALVLLVVAHALAIVPMTYLYSRRFTKHATAQTSMLVFSLASGGLLSIFSFLCRVVDFSMTSSLTLSGLDRDYLRWLFLLFPGYALNSGIYEIATRKITRGSLFGGRNADPRASLFGLFKGFGQDPRCVACWNRNTPGCCVRGSLAFDVALAPALVMLLEAVAFSALVFYLEKRATQGPAKKTEEDEEENEEDQDPGKRATMLQVLPVTSDVIVEQEEDEAEYDEASEGEEGEDDDVVAERRRIDAMPHGGTIDDAIVIRRLHHEYADGRVALQKLSLAIPRGECFGYLGVNGAGKSTTIKVLTRQIVPTSGDVHVAGKNFLNHGRSDADDEDGDRDAEDTGPSVIGYCPQFDALHDLLTVEEELTLYARIKGISLGRVPLEVDDKMHALGLTEYRHKLTRGLSGGNKRKVSTAIALLGSPPIVILDEPSTGMDPSARRKMWNVIASSCAVHRTSVVLTTHSMEECEALCSRVGILVQGRLQCLGSVQHLRHKFGRGFTVDIKLDSEPTKLQVASLRGRAHEILEDDPTEITEEQVAKLCEALGDASRMERIEKAAQKNAEWWSRGAGGVRTMELDQFAAWWLAQDRHDALASFFPQRFPGTTLVEQHGDHVRFHIPKHARESAVGRHDRASEFELRPKAIFQALEIGKQTLWIEEYSVSDTSLEHIFNRMADDGVNDADRLRPTMEADGQRSSRSSRSSPREGSSSMSQYAQGATTGL